MKDFTANLAVCAFCEAWRSDGNDDGPTASRGKPQRGKPRASRPRPCALELTAPICGNGKSEEKWGKSTKHNENHDILEDLT